MKVPLYFDLSRNIFLNIDRFMIKAALSSFFVYDINFWI